MTGKQQIELARRLFEEGWSGGKAEAPLRFLSEDIVMRDILAHPKPMVGHAAIVGFFGPVAANLKVLPEEFFLNERGVALSWMAYIAITNDQHGPENVGRFLCGEGMSRLEFRGDKVCLEIDYWNGPQGKCDDWHDHFSARKRMSAAERGATPGR